MKKPKQGTKANAGIEDAATVCQYLCQLLKMQFFIFIMRSNLKAWHFLCGGLTFSPNTSATLRLSLESYQSVSHNLWCLTSNSSSHFPKAIAAFTPLAANQSVLCAIHQLLPTPQISSSSQATPPLAVMASGDPVPAALASGSQEELIKALSHSLWSKQSKGIPEQLQSPHEDDISKPTASICMTDASQLRNLLHCTVQ